MAVRYTTQDEYMAQMAGAPSETEERDYGLGADTTSQTSASEPSGAETPQETAPTPASSLRGYSSLGGDSGAFGGLFAPVKKTLATAQQDLNKQEATFREAAGPQHSWDSVGGEAALGAAFQPSATPDQVNTAKGLASASYTGPEGFDQASIEALNESLYGAREDAKAAGTVAGASYFTGKAHPGMTAGERRQEGARDVQSPDYKAQVQALRQSVGQGLSGVQQKGREAEQYAAARKVDEDAIAKAARGIAEGRQSAALSDIDARVAQLTADDAALRDAYDRFMETGALDDLVALPGDQGETIAGGQAYQDSQAAAMAQAQLETQWDVPVAVNALGSSVIQGSDIPFLTRQTSSHGKAVLGFPEEWFKEFKAKYNPTKDMVERVRAWAMDRQDAYEKAGFATEQRASLGGKGVLKTDPGRFAAFDPLYGDIEGVTPQDLRSYIGLDEGTGSTRQNTATENERFLVNRASEILGQLELIDENTNPREAAKITGSGQEYLDDLQTAIQEKLIEVTGDRDDAIQKVKEARKKYKKAVSKKHWATAARIVGGVLSLGASEVFEGKGEGPASTVGGGGGHALFGTK